MRIVVKQGESIVNKFDFDKGPICIGRDTNNQVLLRDDSVSRQHAVIQNTSSGHWVVEDLGSTNKTYLGDKKVDKAKIKTGDTIRISGFNLEVNLKKSKRPEPSDTIKLDGVKLDHQEFLRAMTPRFPYPQTDTTFGKSLLRCMKDKHAVTLYVTDNHLFINDEDTLFLSDGSHCYYLFLAILWRCMNVSIITNNVGVAGEYTMQRGRISNFTFLPGGVVDPELGGVFRFKEEEEEALKNEMENTNTFISVRALDTHNGPGCGAPRDQIRRLAIQSGSKVTILCDYLDLCQTEGSFAPAFRGEHIETWRSWLKRGDSYIVTTAHPEVPLDKLELQPDLRGPFNVPQNNQNKNRNSWQLYLYNACQLYIDMQERFVEVDLDGKKLSYNQ